MRNTKYDVSVLKVVQMPDHLHHTLIENTPGEIGIFLRSVSALFVREYNNVYAREGTLFESPYGRAKKITEKNIRTNLLYLDNNPVERQLVKSAEEYRWNYLAYSASDQPYSEKILLNKASMPLRRALKMVKDRYKRGRYLNMTMLKNLFKGLDEKETEQLTDFIVSTYSVIDYEASLSYFKSYESELLAARSTTGKEYDINEHFLGRSDRCYAMMEQLLLRSLKVTDIHQVLSMPMESKMKLLSFILNRTAVPRKQIEAFLHIPPAKA